MKNVAKKKLPKNSKLYKGMVAPLASDRKNLSTVIKGLMAIASLASNKNLAKTVFVVAERRGMGDLLNKYFEIDAEARELYSEYKEVPSKEALRRQRETLHSLVSSPDPDRLMPPARVNV